MAADNVVANSIPVATRSVTYSGDASQNAQVVGAVLLTGSDDAKVATDAIPATAGLDSTGGGIPAVALVAQFDDASTTSVTENQFAHPRLSSRRALLVEGVASGTAVKVDGSGVTQPVSGTVTVTSAVVATATLANVSSSATNVTLLASNGARTQAMIFNDSTATLYVKFGATASATSHTVQLGAGQYYEFPHPVYTGIVDGLWSSANGSARTTEL